MIFFVVLFSLIIETLAQDKYLKYFDNDFERKIIKFCKSSTDELSTRMFDDDDASCGQRLFEPKILGGSQAPKGAWPWIAALGYRTDGEQITYECGGVLISSTAVLTAAHCVFNKENLYVVRLGDNDRVSLARRITESIVHEKYSASSNENDIALIRLDPPVKLSSTIRTICLPQPDFMSLYDKSETWIAGWGSTEHYGRASSVLLQVNITIMKNSVCKDAYDPFGAVAVIDDRVLCAGDLAGGKDACQGDSGGPLMWRKGDGHFQVIGVVSYGYKCGEKDFPGVYTSVLSFLPWIDKFLQDWL